MTVYPQLETLCLFVGHPRSGHTLVGAMLDAHPDVVIAQKLDVLRLVAGPSSLRAVVGAILASSGDAARTGRAASGYDYEIPGQWQGRHRELRVVGDKSAGHTTRRLARSEPPLERLRQRTPLRIQLVQVVRNPLDNIATLVRRGSFDSVDHAIGFYDELCAAVAACDAPVHHLHLEDLVTQPHQQLRALAGALGIEPEDEWLDACGALLWPRVSQTRGGLEWSPEQLAAVERIVGRYPWLHRYREAEARPCA
ncbi:MAG: sulfotransferase [Myxococcales bacterium]|nr:sulfotransferase [Myxococcales bacterium]MCB9715016.1 sulfotransferase [Myxococcales bacterium]